MRCGFNTSGIELIERFHITKNAEKLLAIQGFFFFRERQARKTCQMVYRNVH